MMTRFSFLLALLVFSASVSVSAQDSGDLKYWVFFTQKDDVAGKTVPIEPRALVRRARRASLVPAGLDTPVSEEFVAQVAALGGEPLVRSRWFNAVSAWMSSSEAEAAAALPYVKSIKLVGVSRGVASFEEGQRPFGPVQPPGPNTYRLDYGASFTQLDVVNAIPGLEAGLSGAGVMLGIIDTGAGTITHPALTHITNSGRLKGQENFTGQPDDFHRHALSVLSVAAGFAEGTLIGPAHGADILMARTEYTPTETNQEEDNFVAGMEWLESMGADVVNCSLGYSEFDPGQTDYVYADLDGDTAITTRAADLAASLGVIFVNSAGNEGNGSWFFITSPADADSIIAVGSVTDTRIRSTFSGHGPSADGRIKPDVSAMGSGVTIASGSGYSFGGNGTSFSSPMVAGIVAQMLEVNAALGPIDVREILWTTSSLAGNPNNNIGYGIVDAEAALAAAAIWGVDVEEEVPTTAELRATAYPNPAAGPVWIELAMPAAGDASVVVFDLLGRRVSTAAWSNLYSGVHRLELPLPNGASGWYGFRVAAGQSVAHGSVSVVR
ncbi:MAG: serine protease AprX [Rhodothermales bacterium]|jgi:serine protease AprX